MSGEHLQDLWSSGYCLPEKRKIFIPTDPKMFQKIRQIKSVKIAKLMLESLFNFLDVPNFIICMFSGTVDDI